MISVYHVQNSSKFDEILPNILCPVYTYTEYRSIDVESSEYLYKTDSKFYTTKNFGILLIAETINFIEETILSLAEEHLHHKIIIILESSTKDERESIELLIWEQSYQLHVYVIDQTQSVVTIFNPFENKFYHLLFNDTHYFEVISEIEKIVIDRNFNLNGYRLDLFMFEMKYTSEPIYNTSGDVVGYDLIDGKYLDCVMKYLNFTPNFISKVIPTENIDKTISNTFSIIESNEAMFSSNGRLVMNYSLNNTIFLEPIDNIQMFYVVPVSYQRVALNIFIFDLFSSTTKWTMILSLSTFVCIWIIMRYYNNKMFPDNNLYKKEIILESIAILNSVSTPGPSQLYNRILFLSLVLFTMVISNTYQGTIITQLSIKSTPHQINTLDELLVSNLKISTVSYIRDFLTNLNRSENHIFNKLNNKPGSIYTSMTEGVSVVAYNQTDALLLPALFVGPYCAEIYDNQTGRDLIRTIRQGPISFFLSFIVSKKCPFTKQFNLVLSIYKECGLMRRELNRAYFKTNLLYIKRFKMGQYDKNTEKMQPISLQDIRVLFFYWFFLLCLSILVFFCEILYINLMNKIYKK